ncbi:alpha-L-rhamnosidase [Saccharicrinis aurantiacus]|uniref:alpha-L-rhamnosidase n=1 Tax=Saccharicrinis aurantiacus TaxID=1849719 RepID=UPI0024932315|nr:alpha-L-rhamnosidase [Saccharicrinis aurantiacus]
MKYIRSIIISILLGITMSFSIQLNAKNKVGSLTCEYLNNPIGIDVTSPRFSWKIQSTSSNVSQTAYEIRAAKTIQNLGTQSAQLWSTGKINSNQSINVPYQGATLKSGDRVYWQVRIWDNKNKLSAWSEPAYFELGLLNTSDWKAQWISLKDEKPSKTSLPSQYYRNDFTLDKEIKSARLYVSSLGLYQMFINGKKVGDQLFTPGFTSFHKRIQYQTYDVTDMLSSNNAIGAMLGDGWYRGYIGWDGDHSHYGDKLALIAQLHIKYTDGTSKLVTSNDNWKASYGAIKESDIYNGEFYDANLEQEGWANYNFNSEKWNNVEQINHSKEILVASNSIPVKVTKEIKPIEIITTPKGELVMDLGQNIVGYTRLKVKGKKGDKVTLQFAEVLDKEGNFFTENLRSAKSTDVYVLKGNQEEVYEPFFTFHGFRYVKLEGYPGTATTDDITGIVIHSDMKPTGTFACSDSLINQLQSNIQWGQRCNFLDIPTDCPQRDERVGWTGDAQVFSMTAAFNFDVAAFYTKWLKDLALDQQPNGQVPNIIPDMWNNKLGGATGWADAAVIVPWTVYRAYGDKRILEEQYKSMKAWIGYMKNKSGDDYLWNERHFHWGDWLSYNTDKPAYPGAYTEQDLIATAYYSYSTSIMAKVAKILGKDNDAAEFADMVTKIKAAFAKEYITPNGRLVSHTQTAYALAISFDLIPEDLKEQASNYFANDVKKFKHLTTGFLGTPLLCSSLSAVNRDDLAFMLLNRKEYPSWLYPVTMGATTIWERWDTQKPDGTIIDGMNSFNHYAYGAIGEWLYNYVAGVAIDEENPGYKHILFSPHPGGGLTNASAKINSMYGEVKSEWSLQDGEMTYNICIPPNATASITLPKALGKNIVVNKKPLNKIVNESTNIGNDVSFNLGSGEYKIVY